MQIPVNKKITNLTKTLNKSKQKQIYKNKIKSSLTVNKHSKLAMSNNQRGYPHPTPKSTVGFFSFVFFPRQVAFHWGFNANSFMNKQILKINLVSTSRESCARAPNPLSLRLSPTTRQGPMRSTISMVSSPSNPSRCTSESERGTGPFKVTHTKVPMTELNTNYSKAPLL